jgi:superfamily II DNA or RNA helicase
MSLHPDQIQALADYNAAIAAGHRSPIIVAATGFGKTHTAAHRIEEVTRAGGRVWFLAHLGELLSNTAARLEARGVEFGWIWGGRERNDRAGCQLVSVASAARRLDDLGPPPDLVIIDECHRATTPSYQATLDAIGRPQAMGLTGTPLRSDGRSMRAGGFDALVRTPDTIDLIRSGRLSPLRAWSWPEPDGLKRIGMKGRDFDQEAAGDAMSDPDVLGDAFAEWEEKCCTGGATRPTAIFTSSVRSANETADTWRRNGFRVMAVSGQSSPDERKEALDRMRGGDLDGLISVDMYIAGLDIPDLGAVVCLRKTDSLIIWLQMIGRGLRKSNVWPDCYLLDPVGNCRRPGLGDPLARRMHLWSLDEGSERRLREAVPPVAVCEWCYSTYVVGNRCQEPGCGWVKQQRTLKDYIVMQGKLAEIKLGVEDKKQQQNIRKQEEANCRTLQDWIALAQRRGYTNPTGWARVRYGIRQKRSRAGPVRKVTNCNDP